MADGYTVGGFNLMGSGVAPKASSNTSTPQTAFQQPTQANQILAKINAGPKNISPAPVKTTPGLINQPAVKKVTISPDGSHSTEYHPPTPPAYDSTQFNNNMKENQAQQGASNLAIASAQKDPNSPFYVAPSNPTPTVASTAGALANQGNSVNNQALNTSVSGLNNSGLVNSKLGQEAQDISNRAGQEISNVGQAAGLQEGGLMSGGDALRIGQGGSAIVANTAAARQQAITEGATQALKGNEQALAAQGQTQSALNNAGGLANTGQSNVQSGFLNAGNLVTGQPTSQGQTIFNPATNSFSGGSYQDNLKTVVDSIKNGSMGFTDGAASLASLSPTAKADVLKALGPGFDTVASDANASVKGSNIQTSGTAGTKAAADAYAQSYPAVVTLNQALNNVNSAGNMTVKNAQGADVNPLSLAPANTAISKVRSLLSDAGQVTFNSNIANLQAAIRNIYSSNGGSTPSGIESQIGQMADGSLSVKGLQALITAAQAEGEARLGNAKDTATTEYMKISGGNAGGGSSSAPTSTNTPW